MAIKINWQDLQKRIINWQEVQKVMLNWNQIRPSSWPTPTVNYFRLSGFLPWWWYFQFIKEWNPTNVSLEYSEVETWGQITWWSDLELDVPYRLDSSHRFYIRNKSATPTWFSTSAGDYYHFYVYGTSCMAGGDITYLLCENGTNTLSTCCFEYLFEWSPALEVFASPLSATNLAIQCYSYMFYNCSLLNTAPQLPATTLAQGCYSSMFQRCSSLRQIPELPSTNLAMWCYEDMFKWCTSVKISDTQTWEYQTQYRIPKSWTGTSWLASTRDMFSGTWGTFTWTPSINTTYYTSNQVI